VTDPRTLFFSFVASCIALSVSAAGDDWPQFRGPGGRGIAERQQLPDVWSVESGDNVAWRGRNSLFAVSRPDP
jgi:hypothetical protein